MVWMRMKHLANRRKKRYDDEWKPISINISLAELNGCDMCHCRQVMPDSGRRK